MRILVLIPIVAGFFSAAAAWDYVDLGEDMWKVDYPTCGGQRQSPIDIPASDSSQLKYENLGAITFTGYDSVVGNMVLENNGHTAVVAIPNDGKTIYIEGGGLSGKYNALQFHFHWSNDTSAGSEHTFRGKKYPLELHIVHWKDSYGTVTDAIGNVNGDGLAVVGVFFEISATDNPKLDPVINSLASIRYRTETANIDVSLDDILGSQNEEFYRYEGSLTTPGCNEVVIWTVLEGNNFISEAQLNRFRQMYENVQSTPVDVQMLINYRPVQPLNDRIVTKTYEGDVPSHYYWGYSGLEGADSWQYYYPTCSGHRQSPINIPALFSPDIAEFNAKMELDTLEFVNYDKILTGTISNNGHTVVVAIESPDVFIHKGGLPGKYKAVQFHFHWGTDDEQGSEHTINGMAFPLELHIVHYKVEYGSVAEALKRDDGLAVVGFVYEISESPNAAYGDLLTAMEDVKFKETSAAISGISLQGLTLSNLKKNASSGIHYPYYRYEGGLTTPPCSQVVIWTVMNEPLHMSSAQIDNFREITLVKTTSAALAPEDYITENFRPPQPLVYRQVFLSTRRLVGQPGTRDPIGFKYGYHGDSAPDHWQYYYPACDGDKQSPINIPNAYSDDIIVDETLGLDSLEFINYDKAVTGTIYNTGHLLQVDIESPSMYIQNGGLSGSYKAAQFHFHWGSDNKHGSEHTIDGVAYPLELHIVHYKDSYGSFANAFKHEDGLAVVGFMIAGSHRENVAYKDIVSSLMDVKYKGASKAISGFNMQALTLKELRTNGTSGEHHPYYRYEGSITAPPCSQVVTWSVMNEAIPMSNAQIAEFRKLLQVTEGASHSGDTHSQYITENFRPVQELKSRKVYASYLKLKDVSASSPLYSSLLSMGLAIVFALLLK